MIPSRGGPAPSIHVFAPRAQLRRGVAHHHRTAHLQLAAAPVRSIKAGPGCGAGGRRRGLAGHRDDAPRCRRCGGRRRVRRARAGFEIDHSEPQARVWRSRGRPGPPAPGTPAEPTTRGHPTGCRTNFVLSSPNFPLSRKTRWEFTGKQPIGTTQSLLTNTTKFQVNATKTPEPEAVPGSGGGGWGIRTPEGLHPTRFPSVRHRPLGESSVHIVPDNHKRKMSARANPGQWSRSQARHFKEKGITWGPNPPRLKQSGQQTTPMRHAPTHPPQRRRHPRGAPRPRRLAEPEHVDVGGNANKNPIEHEGGGGLT